jgi:putative ABC transport system permease protein
MKQVFNFKPFFRFLERNRLYTFINVFGLSVSLMFVILIAVYTAQELSVDRAQANRDRIYLMANLSTTGKNAVGMDAFYGTAWRIADRLAGRYPEIERTCPLVPNNENTPVRVDGETLLADLLFADSSFFGVFSFPLVEGVAGQVLTDVYGAVVSESFARRAFPGGEARGRRIAVHDSLTVTVTGVMRDIRGSAVKPADIVVRIENARVFNEGLDSDQYENAGGAVLYLLAREGADLRAREREVTAYFSEFFWFYELEIFDAVAFIPLADVYFSGIETGGMVASGDRTFVLVLLAAGILILLFALMNYVNLTVAQTGFRAKEMATRRLLGASRAELFARLMLESVLLCALSAAAGATMAFAAETYAGNLLETRLDVAAFFTPAVTLAAATLILATGCIAGLLPAALISGARAIDAMKGGLRTRTKTTLGRIFIIFQNAITFSLLTGALTMTLQTRHLVDAPLGYGTEAIIQAQLESTDGPSLDALRDGLESLASVSMVSYCYNTPFEGGNNRTYNYHDRVVTTEWLQGDERYLDILGFNIVRDNALAPGTGYYISRQALTDFDVAEDVDAIRFEEYSYPVAGIVDDVYIRDIRTSPRAVFITSRRVGADLEPERVLVKVRGSEPAAFRDIRAVYERTLGRPFDGQFADRILADRFASQRRLSTIVFLFSLIALVISALGTLAMSLYFIRRQMRSIAVRRVFGAPAWQLTLTLVMQYALYVLLGTALALLPAGMALTHWLSTYSYHIAYSPVIPLAAFTFCLAVALATVFHQSRAAANINPVRSLKEE